MVDYRFPEQRNFEMQLQGKIHINDLELTSGGKGLLLASNIGVQMWNTSDFSVVQSKSKTLTIKSKGAKVQMSKKKVGSVTPKGLTGLVTKSKPNAFLKKQTKTKKVEKKKKMQIGSGASPCQDVKQQEKKQVVKMETSGNTKLNFSTKYNFDIKLKETKNHASKLGESSGKMNDSNTSNLFLLSSLEKNQHIRKQDSQVQYSFPLKGAKAKQKNTLNYLKAEHRVTGFEKNLGDINGKQITLIQ